MRKFTFNDDCAIQHQWSNFVNDMYATHKPFKKALLSQKPWDTIVNDVLLTDYDARFNINRGAAATVVFNSDEGLAQFILRWS